MRENAELGANIADPEDVGAFGSDFGGLAIVQGEFSFVHERTLIAVGLTLDVEADDFAAIGDDVAAVTFDGWRGADADVFPVADFTGAELGDDELPEEFAGLFVEAHEHATVARLFGIAGLSLLVPT